jgi:iron complex outermembrane recepter protein
VRKYLLAASAIALATSAQAQDTTLDPAATTAAAEAEGGALDEIVVTAQKRSESIQDVPVAVSVISGAQIENLGAVNIEQATALVPSLTFRKGGTSLNSSLFLRGVGTINFSIAAEPSVAVVLDGVVLARAGEGFGDLYDLERIEVLRGPQGTLFGKNASAGVVNIVSKKPTDEFGGSLEVSAFEGEEYKVKGTVNAPLSDTVRSRLTAFYGEYDGNIRNLTTGDDINGYQRYGVRGIIEADASEALALTFIADWRKADDDCCGEVIGTAPGTPATNGVLPGVDFREDRTREVRHNLVTQTEEEAWGLSLQGDLEVGDHVLTSITAYRKWDNREIREGDWLDRIYVGVPQLHDDGPQTADTLTQELRLTSPTGQFFEYVVGAYYYKADAERTFTRNVTTCSASTLPPVVAGGAVPCAPGSSTLTNISGTANFGSTFENYALFGQSTINVSDQVRLIAGLRLTRDELSSFLTRVAPVAGPGIATSFTFEGETDKTNLSGKAGVQYDLTDDTMLYATYSRGYKGPAFNVFFNMGATATNVIEAETVDAGEIGAKMTLADGALLLNLAGFYAQYDNFQANNPDLIAGVVVTRLTNAGTVSTRGLEIDFIARPTDLLSLSGGLALTDAQVDEFRVPPGAAPTAVVPSGNPLALSPKWKASLGVDQTIETSLPFDVNVGGQFAYQSKQLSFFDANAVNQTRGTISGYATVDLSAGLVDKDDRWSLRFLVRNATDESFTSLITTGGPGGSLRYLIPREADRYVGAVLKVNFGAR